MPLCEEHPVVDLYCSEEASKVVPWDDEICSNGEVKHNLDMDSDDESYISCSMESEVDQILEQQSLRQLLHKTRFGAARQEAIKWILKVHSYYQFRPETAYLSVNYLNRFLISNVKKDRGWSLQLLSVACLSLAAKMEETRVPLLQDLQIIEPKFLFKPQTVQRMEIFVMESCKWQLRAVTPFDFAHFFVAKLSSLVSSSYIDSDHAFQCASDVIFRTCGVLDFIDYPPSTIAAAASLWATGLYVDDQKLRSFHNNMSKDMVKRCHHLIKQHMSSDFRPKKENPRAQSPVCVLDAATIDRNTELNGV